MQDKREITSAATPLGRWFPVIYYSVGTFLTLQVHPFCANQSAGPQDSNWFADRSGRFGS